MSTDQQFGLLQELVRASGYQDISELDEASARQLRALSSLNRDAVEALVRMLAPGNSYQHLREGLGSPAGPLRSPHAAR